MGLSQQLVTKHKTTVSEDEVPSQCKYLQWPNDYNSQFWYTWSIWVTAENFHISKYRFMESRSWASRIWLIVFLLKHRHTLLYGPVCFTSTHSIFNLIPPEKSISENKYDGNETQQKAFLEWPYPFSNWGLFWNHTCDRNLSYLFG